MVVKNIIFDWSGTISDDFGLLYEVVMEIFEEHGVKRVSREDFLKSYTLPYMASINQFFNVSKEEWDAKFQAKWRVSGFPDIFPFAMSTLDFLKMKGLRLAVLTSHPEEFIHREIQHFFLGKNYFEFVFAGAYDKKGVALDLMGKSGFEKSETILVGDTVHDIETGKHAGVLTAAVLSGYNDEDSLRGASPDFVLEDISHLPSVL